MRAVLTASLTALAACGATEPTPNVDELLGSARLAVVSGNAQRDTIEARLSPIVLELTAGATALPGVGVSFVVPEPDCGAPFAGFAVTDELGRAAVVGGDGAGPERHPTVGDGGPVLDDEHATSDE